MAKDISKQYNKNMVNDSSIYDEANFEATSDSDSVASDSNTDTTLQDGYNIDIHEEHVPGMGVGIVELNRMRNIITRTPLFIKKAFTKSEIEFCKKHSRPYVRYSLVFAAKISICKALDVHFYSGNFPIVPKDIEVFARDDGALVPVLYRSALSESEKQKVQEVHLSLSRTSSCAVANAVLVAQSNRCVSQEQKLNTKEELEQSFKECRIWLDELNSETKNRKTTNTSDGIKQELFNNGNSNNIQYVQNKERTEEELFAE